MHTNCYRYYYNLVIEEKSLVNIDWKIMDSMNIKNTKYDKKSIE